jgi:hypothetical protein
MDLIGALGDPAKVAAALKPIADEVLATLVGAITTATASLERIPGEAAAALEGLTITMSEIRVAPITFTVSKPQSKETPAS